MSSFIDQMPEEIQREVYDQLKEKFDNAKKPRTLRATREEKLAIYGKIIHMLGKFSLPDQRFVARMVFNSIDSAGKTWKNPGRNEKVVA